MEGSASRATPLTLVSGAIAGDDLDRVTTTAAIALGRPIAVAIPALGAPFVRPAGALSPELSDAVHLHATACVAGVRAPAPDGVEQPVAIQIGGQVVGIVTAASARYGSATDIGPAELRAWLEAAAAAASINALIREAQGGTRAHDGAALLLELTAGVPDDLAGFLARCRRAGCELTAGATALAARVVSCETRVDGQAGDASASVLADVAARMVDNDGVPAAVTGPGRLLALVPAGAGSDAQALTARLRACGLDVAASTPRRDPAALTEALREVELLHALADAGARRGGDDDTYRLLIGVLLRDPDELMQLRERTISPLADYDARHDTDLLATLQAFLAHDGSTTETAEAMTLHRHTVGYRLARVHEVSGLSPYESDGRERLGLGLKADHILEAHARAQA
ncbi:MAG: helix-turn-helix domain-containing protein [Actinomycetota bacterium]|nr:helix-turn-helix domain-containing protein [Actinomycetota bacterium]